MSKRNIIATITASLVLILNMGLLVFRILDDSFVQDLVVPIAMSIAMVLVIGSQIPYIRRKEQEIRKI